MVIVTMKACTLKEPAKCDNKKLIGVDGEELNPEGRTDSRYPNELNAIEICTVCKLDCQYAASIDARIPDSIAFPTDEN